MSKSSVRMRGELMPETRRRRFLLDRARAVLAKEPLERWQPVERFGLTVLDAHKLLQERRGQPGAGRHGIDIEIDGSWLDRQREA